jgi:protein-disulfide isomerase-like protein with CxxC motif
VERIVAWHFTDPGCPWAYSSRPAIARLRWRFGDQLDWRLVLIGLSESAERYEARGYTPGRMAAGWRKFEQRFGMPFGSGVVKQRMAGTSRACRAIVAAREESPELGYAALRALQLMQFTTADVLDDDEALRRALAAVDGLDAAAVVGRIDDPEIVAIYEADKTRARSADGRPTHVQNRHSDADGPVRYTAPSVIFETGERWLEVGGFQPFESYDNALANLEPGLERRPAPERAADAVLAYPIGLTTAEVAAIMRDSDLDDADLPATERELIAAVDEGELVSTPAGSDALWRPATAVEAALPAAA